VLGRHGPGVGGRESEGGCKYENGRGGPAERKAQQGTDSGRGECAATTLSTPRPGTPRKKTDALGAPGSRLSVLDVLQRGAERRVSLVHPVELLDVLRRERDPERAEVLPQMLPLVGLRKWSHTLLERPREQDLGRRRPDALGDAAQPVVVEALAARERAVGLDDDAALAAVAQHVRAPPERGPLDLVHDGRLADLLLELPQLVDRVVAHADLPRVALRTRANETVPDAHPETLRRCPVDEHEVGVVLAHIVVIASGRVVSVVVLLDLGGEEDLRAGHVDVAQGVADARLAPVVDGGIDHAIALLDREADRGRGLVRELPRAQ